MKITEHTKLKEIDNAPEFLQSKGQFISGGDFFYGENGELTLLQLQERNPTWNADDVVYGLTRLQEVFESGEQYVHSVYSGGEIKANARLATVKLFFLPAKEKVRNEFVILLAGGAYGAVCTMVESLPVAARFNELGISCFCLNYRTADKDSFIHGLLPEPLDDLAATLEYIMRNSAAFNVDTDKYVVGGFSAGGHAASLWGTAQLGARKYKLPQPEMLMLAYPMITMKNVPDGPMKEMLCTGMFGAGFTEEDIRRYDAASNMDGDYSKTYIVRALDDDTVSPADANSLMTAMNKSSIACRMEQADSGGHGFGLGSATPLRGWTERALAFLDE